ncbi:MAG: hypothetical protein ACKVOW_02235 [Chitinophagaceae bacterium]
MHENVAIDRQGVTDTWTNENVKAAIKNKGIQLISYKDLLSIHYFFYLNISS